MFVIHNVTIVNNFTTQCKSDYYNLIHSAFPWDNYSYLYSYKTIINCAIVLNTPSSRERQSCFHMNDRIAEGIIIWIMPVFK